MKSDSRTSQSHEGLLTWLQRSNACNSPLSLPSEAELEQRQSARIAALQACTYLDDDIYIPNLTREEMIAREHEFYRTINALGISLILTIQWDGKTFRVLRSLVPDSRHGSNSAMGEQLRHRVPWASLARRIPDGYGDRRRFQFKHNLRNHVLLTGQLVGAPEKRFDRADSSLASSFGIDATLGALSLFREPFTINLIAEPLPGEALVGALDFLLAATGLCASGAEVTLSTGSSVATQEGRSELDPQYRQHRAVADMAQGAMLQALTMAGGAAALAIGTGGLAAPLLIAAAAGAVARPDFKDLFGWNAQVSVSTSTTTSDQTTVRKIDERAGYYARKLRELTDLFDNGGNYGLWNWYTAVSASSLSVASGVADLLAGRLSLMGNTLEPLRQRLVKASGSEHETIEEATLLGLIPRIAEPVGLLGRSYGSLVQSQTLPFLFAGPTISHAGIRVIRHHPVTYTQSVKQEPLRLGSRPDDSSIPMQMACSDLAGHLLVCGRTGSGKTVLVRNLLRQVTECERPIPFVFLDMAQSLDMSAWDFAHSPICYESGVNFESPPLPSLGLLDFGMPSEYDHYVWQLADLLTNWLPSEGPLALLTTELLNATLSPRVSAEGHYWLAGVPDPPPLSSLETSIDAVFRDVGGDGRYEGELRSNLRGALLTRVRRLQSGTFRPILDGSAGDFFQAMNDRRSFLISLARSGSGSERAFLALVFLSKVRQWLRATRDEQQDRSRPRLVIALDEAHVLLRKSAERDRGSDSNICAYAVRWFDEFMAEIRQLGAAVILIDQSPAMLADSVLFSTSSKVVLPLSSGADMEAIAGALAVDRRNADVFGTLPNLMGYLRQTNQQDLALVRVDVPGGK